MASAVLHTLKRSSSLSLSSANGNGGGGPDDSPFQSRGLTQFIISVRQCTSVEQERARVLAELNRIRVKFSSAKHHGLSSYDKKKYVWKLVYIKLLGYGVDFGQGQVAELMESDVHGEKLVGYLATSILFANSYSSSTSSSSMVEAILPDLQNDSANLTQSLALHFVGNQLPGGAEHAPQLAIEAWRLARVAGDVNVRKKAVLALLSLARAYPQLGLSYGDETRDDAVTLIVLPTELQVANLMSADENIDNPGFSLTCCALLKFLVQQRQDNNNDNDDDKVMGVLVNVLRPLVMDFVCADGHYYHGTAAPFLQVSILQCLLAMKRPPQPLEVRIPLLECLLKIITTVKWTKNSAVNNASRCVALEALQLVAEYNYGGTVANTPTSARALATKAHDLIVMFLSSKNSNTRYLALNCLGAVARMVHANPVKYIDSPWLSTLNKCQDALVANLDSGDLSVRRKALDLLFHACRSENVDSVANKLLHSLADSLADVLTPVEFRQEIVLRVAVLAEKFACSSSSSSSDDNHLNLAWYLDITVRLLNLCEDEIAPEDLWHRAVRMVSNAGAEEQRRAALCMYRALLAPGLQHSSIMVRVAAWVMGEFGYKLTEYSTLDARELDHDVMAIDLFGACHRHFLLDTDARTKVKTRMILLTAYAKLASIYPGELRPPVVEVLRSLQRETNVELCQRVNEYLAVINLLTAGSTTTTTLGGVFDPMPLWPQKQTESSKLLSELDRRLAKGGASPSPRAMAAPRLSSSPLVGRQSGRLSLSSSSSSSPSASPMASPPTIRPTPSSPSPLPPTFSSKSSSASAAALDRFFWDALLANKSLLFEDGLVQIGSTQTFHRGGTGAVSLFVGNLSAHLTLHDCALVMVTDNNGMSDNLQLVADSQELLEDDGDNTSSSAEARRFTLLPGSQVQHTYSVRCRGPFSGFPKLVLMQKRELLASIHLPVAMTSFLEPFPIDGAAFKERWTKLGTQANRAQCHESLETLGGGGKWHSGLQRMSKLLALVHFGSVAAADDDGDGDGKSEEKATHHGHQSTFLGCARFLGQVGVLVKISLLECSSGSSSTAFIAVRATKPDVALALHPVLVGQVTRLFAQ